MSQQHLREEMTRSRGLHEPVAAEAAAEPEPGHAGRLTDDRLVVRGHLVQPGPSRLDGGVRERGQPPGRVLDKVLEESPRNVGVEGGRLGRIAHAQEQAVAFRMNVERRVEVDSHRR